MVELELKSLAIAFLPILFISSQFSNASFDKDPTVLAPNSWINKPSSTLTLVQPVLVQRLGSSVMQLVFGFYCHKSENTYCLVGVLIVHDMSELKAELVWAANRDKTVGPDATLQLVKNGGLVLQDSDGLVVWSTNTSGKPVSGLNLTDSGDLVIFGENNETLWQSFDHPTDTLLIGQKLVPGQSLTASVSASNWSSGLFVLSVGHDRMSAYINTNPPQGYFLSGTFTDRDPRFLNGSFYDLYVPPIAYDYVPQFLKFGPDGHLKVYQWYSDDQKWKELTDLLSHKSCWYPLVCGNYGICSEGQCVGCPESNGTALQGSFFKQIDSGQPDLGCSVLTPISCGFSRYHSLIELKRTIYFPFEYFLYNSSIHGETQELDICKAKCLNECSCRAALFVFPGSQTKGGCLLFNEVFSLIDNESGQESEYNTSLFVKVQSRPTRPANHKEVVVASSLGALVGVVLVIITVVTFMRRRSDEFDDDSLCILPGMPCRYSYDELKRATNNFSTKLGQGGFGSVYEGVLSSGNRIAVKCLEGVGLAKDSFLAEVKSIGSIHHVNLVKLVGFCTDKHQCLLVYEYMANGSLDRWIFGENQHQALPWHTRRKILVDIAKGLAYLHEDCSQKILHLDIKPQNILLDEDLNAKLSDFGLSKLIDKDQSRVVTVMRGTPGYLAPEWLSSAITEKVDVYSFGVVLLETLCGRRNLDWSRDEDERHLLGIFKRKIQEEDQVWDMVDSSIKDLQLQKEESMEMLKIAAWCLQGDFTRRPSMSIVVKVLERLVNAETNLDCDFTTSSAFKKFSMADLNLEATSRVSSSFLDSALSEGR